MTSRAPGPGRARTVASGVLAVLLGAVTGSAAPARAAEDHLPASPITAADTRGAVVHLRALQRIADADGGTRVAGSRGYADSVDYVVSVLRRLGFPVITPGYSAAGGSGDAGDSGGTRDARSSGGRTARGGPLHSVVAQTRTGDPNRVVMIGAHLDSVAAGPGLDDDGSGVAALLEIATRMGARPGLRNAVRFAFWGSEEDDLQGSTSYVEGLPVAQRRRLLLYLNVDMVAAPNSGFFVQGGTGRGAEQTGPPGSAAVARTVLAELARVGVRGRPDVFTGDDDGPFVAAGIPTAGVLSGSDDRMTADQARIWGGHAGVAYDRCYHAACDTLNNINAAVLDRFTRALAGAVARLAQATGSPAGG